MLRIVEGVQAFVEDAGRQRVVFRDREPFLIRVVHEIAFGNLLAQIEIGEEVVGGQALEIFTQRGGQRGFFAGAFAVGEAQRAIAIANVH